MKAQQPTAALPTSFFDDDAQAVARKLLGKVLRHRVGGLWLSAMLIETEAYYRAEKGSHASLGRTPSREATFMAPGTIYMYHARGAPSMNVSARGEGNAVLFKSGLAWTDETSDAEALARMLSLNPTRSGRPRQANRLCSGQTLLCRSMSLEVADWNKKQFDSGRLYLEDIGYRPQRIVVARRLGIPPGRDEHLMYRFLDADYADHATHNPLRSRTLCEGRDYFLEAQMPQSQIE